MGFGSGPACSSRGPCRRGAAGADRGCERCDERSHHDGRAASAWQSGASQHRLSWHRGVELHRHGCGAGMRHSGAHGTRLRGSQRRRTRIRSDARGGAACRGDGSRAAGRRVGPAHRDRAGRKMPRHRRDRGNRTRLGTHGGRVRHAACWAGTARPSPRICPAVRLAWTICCVRPMSCRCILR